MNVREAFYAYRDGLHRRSKSMPAKLNRTTFALTSAWAGLFLASASFRILTSPVPTHNLLDWLEILIPYGIIAFAPMTGYAIATASISNDMRSKRNAIHLSRIGSWSKVSWRKARKNPLFGSTGIMVSLLIGILLNVAMRSIEFLLAVPALNNHAPAWGQGLFLMMAANVALMSLFYMAAFALALKAIPLFPKTLLFAWILDVLIQLLIARQIGAMADLPAEVAAPLGELLQGNIHKVLISMFVWIPYLVLSARVNLTYRRRVPRD